MNHIHHLRARREKSSEKMLHFLAIKNILSTAATWDSSYQLSLLVLRFVWYDPKQQKASALFVGSPVLWARLSLEWYNLFFALNRFCSAALFDFVSANFFLSANTCKQVVCGFECSWPNALFAPMPALLGCLIERYLTSFWAQFLSE